MILTFVTNGAHVKLVPNFCYVIANPRDWSYSYCLPLFIISYNNHTPVTYVDQDNLQSVN